MTSPGLRTEDGCAAARDGGCRDEAQTGVLRLRHYTLPGALLLADLALGPAMRLTAPAPARGPWLVVVPPWEDAPALLASAGARPVGATVAPFALMVDGPKGTLSALRASGAWAVLDARRLAALCGLSVPEGG